MIIFKNIENLTFFYLENDEEIQKFCVYFYENDNYIKSHFNSSEEYEKYIKKITKPLVVDSLKTEKLLNEFSKTVQVNYDDEIYQERLFDEEPTQIENIEKNIIRITGTKEEIEQKLKKLLIDDKIELDRIEIKSYKSFRLKNMEEKLKQLIEEENYEECAEMRDEIDWFKKRVMNP